MERIFNIINEKGFEIEISLVEVSEEENEKTKRSVINFISNNF